MFEGITEDRVDVGDGIELRVRHGGSGSSVALLHGHPRTHTTWHRVAPRAGLGVDRAADEDRVRGRRIACTTLVLWSSRDDLEDLHGDVLGIWRPWTTELAGGPIDSGHHVAEENPEELSRRLVDFLAG